MRRAVLAFLIGELLLIGGAHCSSYGENTATPTPSSKNNVEGGTDLPGCDASKDPREERCLLAEGSSSVFVSTHGNDSAAGTRSAPVLTVERGIAVAIQARKARLILCDGSYPEVVEIKGNVSALPELGIHGGFDCLASDWPPTEKRTRIVSNNPIAMRISPSATRIKLRDLDLAAANGDVSFKQSIGIALTNANVDIKRVRITAGNGFTSTSRGASPSNKLDTLAGAPAGGTVAGPARTCMCPRFGSSTGAKGGNIGFDGDDGSMDPPTTPLANNHGIVNAGLCNGMPGRDGSGGDAGVGAATIGTMDPLGFIESSGGGGAPGYPGQGGGGGAGMGGNSGGGGGCGSCGGSGGALGDAGGSSIGILAWRSKLAIAEVEIQTGLGGNGAKGGDGETPIPGGMGGAGSSSGTGCQGGAGGLGGVGGGGGGGAGGSTFGILYYDEGPAPLIDGAPLPSSPSLSFIRLGAAGAGGFGGAPAGSKGVDGQSAAVFLMPNDLVKR